MKKSFAIILFVLMLIFFKVMVFNFDKIENEIIDLRTNAKVEYTTRSEIEKLLNNNREFFDIFVDQLRQIENIEKYTEISIPFDYPKNDVMFYGYEDDTLKIDDNLKNKLETLSNKLKINAIYIIPTLNIDESQDKLNKCDFIFTQTNFLNNTYIGLLNSSNYYSIKEKNFLKVAFTIDRYRVFGFKYNINTKKASSNWYYYCSRNLDKKNYTFWHRIYDIVKGNL